MEVIIQILIAALGFFLGARYLNGVRATRFSYSILVAVIVAILSVTVGFLLKVLTLGLLGYGIFSLLLDALLIQMADYFLDDFEVDGFWWAVALASIVALVKMVVNGLLF